MTADLKLGLNTGYWGAGPPHGAAEAIAAADALGFHSIWTAEAYGSDALSPLAWWGSQTANVQLGTAIMQIGWASRFFEKGEYFLNNRVLVPAITIKPSPSCPR